MRWNAAIDEILGQQNPPGVTGVRLRDTITGAERELTVGGLFVAIGHTPNTGFLGGQLELHDTRPAAGHRQRDRQQHAPVVDHQRGRRQSRRRADEGPAGAGFPNELAGVPVAEFLVG